MSLSDQTRREQLARIVGAFNRSRHDEARRLCEEQLRHQPRDPALNHLLAAILFAKGEIDGARSRIETSLLLKPDYAPAQLLAGRIARAAGNLDAAIAHLEQAVALAGTGEALLELARTVEAAGQRSRAQNAWHAVLRANPDSREAAARLGRLLWEQGELMKALPMLEKAVAGEAPASAWFDLGMVRQDLHDLDGAAAAYRKGLDKRPDYAEAAVNLGVVLQDRGDLTAAIAAYRSAYRLRPSTFGVIATALTSAQHGRLWLNSSALKQLLAG